MANSEKLQIDLRGDEAGNRLVAYVKDINLGELSPTATRIAMGGDNRGRGGHYDGRNQSSGGRGDSYGSKRNHSNDRYNNRDNSQNNRNSNGDQYSQFNSRGGSGGGGFSGGRERSSSGGGRGRDGKGDGRDGGEGKGGGRKGFQRRTSFTPGRLVECSEFLTTGSDKFALLLEELLNYCKSEYLKIQKSHSNSKTIQGPHGSMQTLEPMSSAEVSKMFPRSKILADVSSEKLDGVLAEVVCRNAGEKGMAINKIKEEFALNWELMDRQELSKLCQNTSNNRSDLRQFRDDPDVNPGGRNVYSLIRIVCPERFRETLKEHKDHWENASSSDNGGEGGGNTNGANTNGFGGAPPGGFTTGPPPGGMIPNFNAPKDKGKGKGKGKGKFGRGKMSSCPGIEIIDETNTNLQVLGRNVLSPMKMLEKVCRSIYLYAVSDNCDCFDNMGVQVRREDGTNFWVFEVPRRLLEKAKGFDSASSSSSSSSDSHQRITIARSVKPQLEINQDLQFQLVRSATPASDEKNSDKENLHHFHDFTLTSTIPICFRFQDSGCLPQGRNEQLSRTLTSTLRHGAQREGVKIRSDGYVSVDELLTHDKYRNWQPALTHLEIKMTVQSNAKKRFELKSEWSEVVEEGGGGRGDDDDGDRANDGQPSPKKGRYEPSPFDDDNDDTHNGGMSNGLEGPMLPPGMTLGGFGTRHNNMGGSNTNINNGTSSSPSGLGDRLKAQGWKTDKTGLKQVEKLYIRATQGHTLSNLKVEELMKELTYPELERLTVLHGTYQCVIGAILSSGGLKTMGRNHIHFTSQDVSDVSPRAGGRSPRAGSPAKPTVISGMRQDCDCVVEVDAARALLESGGKIKFWRSSNGVILTSGIPEDQAGSSGSAASSTAGPANPAADLERMPDAQAVNGVLPKKYFKLVRSMRRDRATGAYKIFYPES